MFFGGPRGNETGDCTYVRYLEETIYEQTQENLWGQSLNASLEFNESFPWV